MSAFGLLTSPVGFELVRSHRVGLDRLTPNSFAEQLERLANDAMQFLDGAGIPRSEARRSFRLDLRYDGQGYEVEVPLPDGAAPALLLDLPRLFAAAYALVFGQSFEDWPVEIVAWKVEVQGPVPGEHVSYSLAQGNTTEPVVKARRPIYLPEHAGAVEVPVYDRYSLKPGMRVAGPALVEERESTCVLGAGDVAAIDAQGNLVIDLGEAA